MSRVPEPPFLNTGETTRRLGRTTLQSMFGYIPHVYVLKPETRLFPKAYIDAFAAYLKASRQKATVDAAESFWRTYEAKRLYTEATKRLETGLSRQTLTADELSGLLGVPRTTILGWGQRDILKTLRPKVRPKFKIGGGGPPLLFLGRDIKQAIQWKVPTTRKKYVPPRQKSMFMSTVEVNNLVRRQRRKLDGTIQFGQLQTPGGGRALPVVYVKALLKETTGSITNLRVQTFNTTQVAREVIKAAEKEFEQRLAERLQVSPFNGLLALEDVAWLLGVGPSIVKTWCKKGHLPYVTEQDTTLVQPQVLQAHCSWVLPTRG